MKLRRSNLKPVSGTTREERFLPALNPAYAPIDERSCPEYMAYALDYARLLNYYGPDNKPDGNWSQLFGRDLSFLLARIVTTDFQREHFKAWALQTAVKDGRESTREILKFIYKMVGRIDEWNRWAGDIALKENQENPLHLTLETIISTDLKRFLGPHIESILKNLPAPAHGTESLMDFWQRRAASLSPVWQISEEDQRLMSLPAIYPKPVDGLLAIMRAMQMANHKLRVVSRQYIDDYLAHRSDHPAHTALYIAFSKLLDQLREKINGITGRHLDFYYHDVLKLQERGSSPDTAHICFELAPPAPVVPVPGAQAPSSHAEGYMLPAGTRLDAGKDPQGNAIEYTTDEDVFINRARIGKLQALYLSHDSFRTSATMPDRIVTISALPHVDSEDGLGEPLTNPAAGWPTFGINETSGGGPDPRLLHAELGFVVASPALLLQEGERNVIVTIAFSGDNRLDAALLRYQTAANEVLDMPASIESLLADAFLLHVSGEKGWMPMADASFHRHPVVGTTMEMEFTLATTDPAIVANPEIAAAVADNSPWPLFKLALNPYARVYAYSFFSELEIETIEIRVSVRGLRKLKLRTDMGPMDGSQPFPVFGPIPMQGSYLLVGHRELSVKRLDHTTVTMTWFNLPKPPSSLESRYASYGRGITDESFKVRMTVHGTEQWMPPAGGMDTFPLFARDYDHGRGLLPTTVLAADMPEIPVPATEQPMPDAITEALAPRGTLRIELAEPAMAFGHEIYPQLMTEAATANAKAGKNTTPKPLPNPPLTPVVKSLVLDYDASDKLALAHPLPESQPSRFYSLYPFGRLAHLGRVTSMFPLYEEQGHLYLGFKELGPRQALTVLFEIRDAGFSPVPTVRHHHEDTIDPIIWRYLSGNQWKEFPAWLVLSDSTMGLTRSGIVKFSMPEDFGGPTTLRSDNLTWIEAACRRVADVNWCSVVSVATQAVTARRVCDPQRDLLPATLPARTITQLVEKRQQIKTVLQPFVTSGGRNREDTRRFRARVSERLRHKGRAIQTFDYERLILDEFPEVGQVKCIGHNHSLFYPGTIPLTPGTLYIVATPRLEDYQGSEPRLPQFMLLRIRDFIQSHTSAFAKDIHVINPVYETLKVFANVEFNTSGDGAYFSDDLNAAISRHLLPWRTTPPRPMPIGSGQVQGYEISQFIQQQPYVNRMHSLAMLHTYQTENGYVSRWRTHEQRAWASAPWAVLIPAANHGITIVDPDANPPIDPGIHNLTVGEDLVMSPVEEKKEEATEKRYYLVIPRHILQQHPRD